METTEIRKCKYCNEILPKNSHGLRTFCQNKIESDGSIKSCKDDYNNAGKKPKYNMLKGWCMKQWTFYLILKLLYERKKVREIEMTELANYGIDFNYSLFREKVKGENKFVLYYLQYYLLPISETKIKIVKHDRTI